MRDVCALIYGDNSRNYDNQSFDYKSWVGLSVVRDCLERAGITVGACSPEDAAGTVVLVSITSAVSWYAFLQAAASPAMRQATILIGGPGVSNVRPFVPLQNAVFAWGRAEGYVVPLVEALRQDAEFEHESVAFARMFDASKTYKVCSGVGLYPRRVKLYKGEWTEQACGCRYRCAFCNYSWTRLPLQDAPDYEQQMRLGRDVVAGATNFSEDNLRGLTKKLADGSAPKGMVNSAIDGQSQRIRDAVHKPLTREELREFGKLAPGIGTGYASLMTVVGFPTETPEDRREALDDLAAGMNERNAGDCAVIDISPQSFRPMPCTPAALWPADIRHWNASLTAEWCQGVSPEKKKYIALIPGHRARIWLGYAAGGAARLLIDLLVLRGTEDDHDALMRVACSKRFWGASDADRVATLAKHFDLAKIAGEFTPEDYPVRYLEGHTPNSTVWRIGARGLRQLRSDKSLQILGVEDSADCDLPTGVVEGERAPAAVN